MCSHTLSERSRIIV